MKYEVIGIAEVNYQPTEGLEPFAVTGLSGRGFVIWCRRVVYPKVDIKTGVDANLRFMPPHLEFLEEVKE